MQYNLIMGSFWVEARSSAGSKVAAAKQEQILPKG